MNWKPLIEPPKLVVVNSTMLIPYNEERCKYCGKFGCTDRGITYTLSDPPMLVGEEVFVKQVIDKIKAYAESGKDVVDVRCVDYSESQCIRKLKKSNAEAVLEKMKACGEDCDRNSDPCPFRNQKDNVCTINVALDDSPLVCQPNDQMMWDCHYHEKSFKSCFRKQSDGTCGEFLEKFGVIGEKDRLVLLNHRFSAAPCRYLNEGLCSNAQSPHHEGTCTLQGLMVTCEQYEAVSGDHAYTEGVCTYVSSIDGKDDRKIFNSSDYSRKLEPDQRATLCMACRISHMVAKLTGLKCLGVRRSASNPFLNEKNPLADHAIQINYLYLTHPEDMGKFNPSMIALAVYLAMIYDCVGLECEEYETCNFNLS